MVLITYTRITLTKIKALRSFGELNNILIDVVTECEIFQELRVLGFSKLVRSCHLTQLAKEYGADERDLYKEYTKNTVSSE